MLMYLNSFYMSVICDVILRKSLGWNPVDVAVVFFALLIF